MPDIFTKVMVAIIATSGGRLRKENCTVDFLQNPSLVPTSTERRNESRPDGYLVLKTRNREVSKTGAREDILWGDIAVSCEYKQGNGEMDIDDVRIRRGLLHRVLG
jgi:hypothetical protein